MDQMVMFIRLTHQTRRKRASLVAFIRYADNDPPGRSEGAPMVIIRG
jgi:hypothetical protein